MPEPMHIGYVYTVYQLSMCDIISHKLNIPLFSHFNSHKTIKPGYILANRRLRASYVHASTQFRTN